jgi:hypothetical protein
MPLLIQTLQPEFSRLPRFLFGRLDSKTSNKKTRYANKLSYREKSVPRKKRGDRNKKRGAENKKKRRVRNKKNAGLRIKKS